MKFAGQLEFYHFIIVYTHLFGLGNMIPTKSVRYRDLNHFTANSHPPCELGPGHHAPLLKTLTRKRKKKNPSQAFPKSKERLHRSTCTHTHMHSQLQPQTRFLLGIKNPPSRLACGDCSWHLQNGKCYPHPPLATVPTPSPAPSPAHSFDFSKR